MSSNQSGFITFGGPHVLDLLARVANHALKAAWYHKWVVHRRLRPEEFGGRHPSSHDRRRAVSDPREAARLAGARGGLRRARHLPLSPGLSRRLPDAPGLPRWSREFIGAGVTVLKAFFNEAFVIPNPVVPSEDGLSLQPWTGEPLTVGHELNKLACNVAFGRDTAGVHFRQRRNCGEYGWARLRRSAC